MNSLANKIGLQLIRLGFVRRAIDERADLSAFKGRPDWRIFLGMFLIALSFIACWPLISALAGLALYWHRPWIATLGIPVYFLSHGMYLAGMALCGSRYSIIFLRWLTRVGVKRLLSDRPLER